MNKIILTIIILFSISFAEFDEWGDYYVHDSDDSNRTTHGFKSADDENFTSGERFVAFLLNTVPGLGSAVIMDDIEGAAMQWTFLGLGLLSIYALSDEGVIMQALIGVPLIWGGFIYGLHRVVTYDKPLKQNSALSRTDGFDIAILPNRHGDFKTYLFYNKSF